MEKLGNSLKVRHLVERDNYPYQSVSAVSAPAAGWTSLYFSPLACCHHQPADEQAENMYSEPLC